MLYIGPFTGIWGGPQWLVMAVGLSWFVQPSHRLENGEDEQVYASIYCCIYRIRSFEMSEGPKPVQLGPVQVL